MKFPEQGYSMRLFVEPDSGWARGGIELAFFNNLGADVDRLLFHWPIVGRHDLLIDSVTCRNVVIPQDQLLFENTLLTLNIDPPLEPGKTYGISFDFEILIDQPGKYPIDLSGWYPQLAAFRPDGYVEEIPLIEPALMASAIVIDSNYSVAAAGKYANEAVRLRQLPCPDDGDLMIDLAALSDEHTKAWGQRTDPKKDRTMYLFRQIGVKLDMVYGSKMKQDRVVVDGTQIDVFYPETTEKRWQQQVVEDAAAIISELTDRLGAFPMSHLAIYPVDTVFSYPFQSRSIALPARLKGRDKVRAALAVELTRKYFVPSFSAAASKNRPVRLEGIIHFIAGELLRDLFPDDGLRGLYSYQQWQYGQYRKLVKKVTPQSQAFASYVFDSTNIDVFPTTSALTFMLSQVIPGNNFWSLIDSMTSGNGYYPQVFEFDQLIASDSSAARLAPILVSADPFDVDYDLKQVEYDKTDSGHIATATVRSLGSANWPVTIRFVDVDGNEEDRLLEESFADSTTKVTISCQLVGEPNSVLIDPDHFLPDRNRDNNVWNRMPVRTRYSEPRNYYPGFKWVELLRKKKADEAYQLLQN
jgi:hypothetical protein